MRSSNAVVRIFHHCLELPQEQRTKYLERACAGDQGLRQEVESLLQADAGASNSSDPEGFLDRPPLTEAARCLLAEGPGSTQQPEEAPPSRIGPYRVLRKLADGGMGTVYQGRREATRRSSPASRVAIKLLRRGMDTDRIVRRFHQEKHILANLEHDHIAHLLDSGAAEDGRPYLVMEYIEGEPIDRSCLRRRLGVEERLRLFLQVCDAVEHAHQRGVVHRDLKPSNILVTARGEPKLLDFGIAKLLDPGRDQSLTATGIHPLTPSYASPEQLRGERITPITDVFSLGALLYELLAGVRPGGGRSGSVGGWGTWETPAQRLHRLARDRPQAPSAAVHPSMAAALGQTTKSLQRRLQGDLDAIVLTAIRFQPRARYPSVALLAADLERHLAGEPLALRSRPWRGRTRRFLLRNRLGLALGAGSLLLLLSTLGRRTKNS